MKDTKHSAPIAKVLRHKNPMKPIDINRSRFTSLLLRAMSYLVTMRAVQDIESSFTPLLVNREEEIRIPLTSLSKISTNFVNFFRRTYRPLRVKNVTFSISLVYYFRRDIRVHGNSYPNVHGNFTFTDWKHLAIKRLMIQRLDHSASVLTRFIRACAVAKNNQRKLFVLKFVPAQKLNRDIIREVLSFFK